MRILYAIQGTGNGHLSRARAVIPLLAERGELDILISGTEADVHLPYPIQFRSKGISFHYNQRAGIDYVKTLIRNPPWRILKDVNSFPIENYDLVINDFEPITAWAAKKREIPCIALSHQASFLSPKTPRPKRRNPLGEYILSHYAPAPTVIGFHFESYDDFIYTPVIRDEIRNVSPVKKNHYTVYLPAVGVSRITSLLAKLPHVNWQVFSRYKGQAYEVDNIQVFPIENDSFIQSFTTCTGILTSAGFETPAEALFMGKKLMVSPIKGQYEQACNAVGLEKMGIPVVKGLGKEILDTLNEWLEQPEPTPIFFPDHLPEIIDKLFETPSFSPSQPSKRPV